MKRYLRGLVPCLLALALLAGGSGALAAQGVFDFLGGKYAGFADRFAEERPVAVCHYAQTMAGGPEAYLWDDASIQQLFDALSGMTVGAADNTYVTDSDYIYAFVMEDGSRVSVLFNQEYLEKDGVRYEVQNVGPLWTMGFPYYSSHTPFTLFADADMSAFADAFSTNTPVSVSFSRDDGPTATVTDVDFIKKVFYAIEGLETVWIENDRTMDVANTVRSEFTFTMADGKTYALSLHSLEGHDGEIRDYLAVQPPVEQIGTQYYQLDGADPLWALPFPGYEQIKSERGITDDLLPLYGADVAALFEFTNSGAFETLTVTRRSAGQAAETLTFLESDQESVSDLAHELDRMDYSERLDAAPDGGDEVTFVFTDAGGATQTFVFVDCCAAVPEADGSTGYYRVVHEDIDENGLMDLVYAEQALLAWKREVNFRGESKPDTAGTVRGILAIVGALAVLAGLVFGVVRLTKSARAKRRAASEQTDQKE